MNQHEINQLMDRAIFARFAQLLADNLSDGTSISTVPVDELKYRAEEEVTQSVRAHLHSMTSSFGKVDLKDGGACYSVVDSAGVKTDVWADNIVQARMKAKRSGIDVAGVEAV